tara:strand:+ start:192 stop:413 length:222 start_codon:yes stop_codon:yes gene_type:complete
MKIIIIFSNLIVLGIGVFLFSIENIDKPSEYFILAFLIGSPILTLIYLFMNREDSLIGLWIASKKKILKEDLK